MKKLYLILLVSGGIFFRNSAQNVALLPTGFTPPSLSYLSIMSLPSPAQGSIVFDSTHKVIRLFSGSQWVALLGEEDSPPAWKAGGTGSDAAYAIAADARGNVYITGSFYSTATFGATTLTSSGGSDIFLAKYNSLGILIWAQKAGGVSDNEIGSDIVTDTEGNVYITGRFYGTASFGSINLTVPGAGSNLFLAKYNNNGTIQWANQQAGSLGVEKIAVDANGNTYLTGYLYGTATFGNTTLLSSGNDDMFLVKYNTGGIVQWTQKAGGSGSDRPGGIEVDINGNVYLTGYFSGTATFGTVSMISAGNYDIFIAKYTGSGGIEWVQKIGSTNGDYGYKITTDTQGNSYIAGYCPSTTTIGLTTISGNFIAKYNSTGIFQWVQKAGTSGETKGITVDTNGNVFITGSFYASTTFGTITLTSSGSSDMDIFIAKYNNSGTLQWAQRAGGVGTDSSQDIAAGMNGNVYLTGYFQGAAAFGTTNLTSAGSFDAFVMRIIE